MKKGPLLFKYLLHVDSNVAWLSMTLTCWTHSTHSRIKLIPNYVFDICLLSWYLWGYYTLLFGVEGIDHPRVPNLLSSLLEPKYYIFIPYIVVILCRVYCFYLLFWCRQVAAQTTSWIMISSEFNIKNIVFICHPLWNLINLVQTNNLVPSSVVPRSLCINQHEQ